MIAILAVLLSTAFASTEAASFSLASEDPAAEKLPYRPDFFHAVYLLASAYVAMLFTGVILILQTYAQIFRLILIA